jgi:hypothetical protein
MKTLQNAVLSMVALAALSSIPTGVLAIDTVENDLIKNDVAASQGANKVTWENALKQCQQKSYGYCKKNPNKQAVIQVSGWNCRVTCDSVGFGDQILSPIKPGVS